MLGHLRYLFNTALYGDSTEQFQCKAIYDTGVYEDTYQSRHMVEIVRQNGIKREVLRYLRKLIGVNWYYVPFISSELTQRYLEKRIEFEKDGDVFRAQGEFSLREDIDWFMPERTPGRTVWCYDFLKYYERYASALSEGDVVLEVGTATGEYTVEASRNVGPDGEIYTFEADPRNIECARKNVDKHGLDNVVTENKAVSEESGQEVEFLLNKNSLTGHRFLSAMDADIDPSEDEGWELVRKKTVSLDDYCDTNGISEVDVIKLTVNGLEPQILKGSQDLLDEAKYVFIPDSYQECLELLKKKNFSIEDRCKLPRHNYGPTLLKSDEYK
jgi:FkbM family methyltransferase